MNQNEPSMLNSPNKIKSTYNPVLTLGKRELKIQTTADLNGKRYHIMSEAGYKVRAGTFNGYSYEVLISTCGLQSGSYILTIDEEKINFEVTETA